MARSGVDPFRQPYSYNQPFEDHRDADVAQDGNEFDTPTMSFRKWLLTPGSTSAADGRAPRQYSRRSDHRHGLPRGRARHEETLETTL